MPNWAHIFTLVICLSSCDLYFVGNGAWNILKTFVGIFFISTFCGIFCYNFSLFLEFFKSIGFTMLTMWRILLLTMRGRLFIAYYFGFTKEYLYIFSTYLHKREGMWKGHSEIWMYLSAHIECISKGIFVDTIFFY